MSCVASRECPAGSICHKMPSLSLCIISNSADENHYSQASHADTRSYEDQSSFSRNPHPKVDVSTPRSHCVDSCSFASDGRCEDGGPRSVASYCELGSDCSDCGSRQMKTDFDSTAVSSVKHFDTLNSIGAKWGVRAGALELWNRIGDPTRLGGVNQKLIVSYEGYLEEQRRVPAATQKRRAWARRASRAKALIRLVGGEQRFQRFMSQLLFSSEKSTPRECKTPTRAELALHPTRTKVYSQFKESTDIRGDLQRLRTELFHGDGTAASRNSWFWEPSECSATDTVLVVVPFRKRETFLPALLARLHPLLRKQRLRYRIFVVDQVGKLPFNRAKLLNVGAVEAMRLLPLGRSEIGSNLLDKTCFVFHDVDLHPVSDSTPYFCPKGPNPHHLSVNVDTHGGKCVYGEIFGGVTSLTVSQMSTVNGFSNDYWGWGGEDDDMSQRIRRGAGLKIERPASCNGVCHWEAHCLDQMGAIEGYEVASSSSSTDKSGHFVMVGGSTESVSGGKAMDRSQGAQLAIAAERYYGEGLTTLNYELVGTEHTPLFTRLRVKL